MITHHFPEIWMCDITIKTKLASKGITGEAKVFRDYTILKLPLKILRNNESYILLKIIKSFSDTERAKLPIDKTTKYYYITIDYIKPLGTAIRKLQFPQ